MLTLNPLCKIFRYFRLLNFDGFSLLYFIYFLDVENLISILAGNKDKLDAWKIQAYLGDLLNCYFS